MSSHPFCTIYQEIFLYYEGFKESFGYIWIFVIRVTRHINIHGWLRSKQKPYSRSCLFKRFFSYKFGQLEMFNGWLHKKNTAYSRLTYNSCWFIACWQLAFSFQISWITSRFPTAYFFFADITARFSLSYSFAFSFQISRITSRFPTACFFFPDITDCFSLACNLLFLSGYHGSLLACLQFAFVVEIQNCQGTLFLGNSFRNYAMSKQQGNFMLFITNWLLCTLLITNWLLYILQGTFLYSTSCRAS